MGVPIFFRWLTSRNPKIIKDASQQNPESYQSGNPSIDNFYIDMNGLIHPSCNPKGQNIKIPSNFQQQCQNIFNYIDKLINIIRPKKTLYLAIDGVAPRAKMNQQRSRRFRAALQNTIKGQKKLQLLDKFKQLGAWNQQVQNYAIKKDFDSNMITPGTIFLHTICGRLRQYIKNRLENHKLWKNLIVVFSDANCPGEGEHKIMDFIRQERASPDYSANQSHCIYGADADLIMLSLATHEPKFYIIREVFITANDKFCSNCHKRGHFFMDCNSANSIEDQSRVTRQYNTSSINVQFQIIRIQMVRQYIHINFMRSIIPFGYDIERIIDDFVFLCFFVGNDFLPHIPCLQIREGGIDVLLRVYEYCLSIMPDYITNTGVLNMKSLKIFIEEMTYYQQSLIDEMIVREADNKQREANNKIYQERDRNNRNKQDDKNRNTINNNDNNIEIDLLDPLGSFKNSIVKINQDQAIDIDDYSVFNHGTYNYKQKYYRQKFKITAGEFLELRNNVSKCYVEALKWICAYYYKGVPSWSWFYPFHYSPFFTDLTIPQEGVQNFNIGIPFKPFEQLMAVLPSKTCDALPQFLHYYMKNIESPIIDYYPSNFHIDLIGKKYAWLGEVILPFIDDKRLLAVIGNYQQKLTQQQKYRNRFGECNMYINRYGELGRKINKLAKKGQRLQLCWQKSDEIDGILIVREQDDNYIGFEFIQPIGREHKIKLKDEMNFNPLQQINQSFISRTDKRAYGGQRYLRIIQTVMQQRKLKLRNNKIYLYQDQIKENKNQDKQDKKNHGNKKKQQIYHQTNNDRERSREKIKNYKKNHKNDHYSQSKHSHRSNHTHHQSNQKY